jgi:acetylornithine/succinyldiaminopimelate/putrescine aminotransferase
MNTPGDMKLSTDIDIYPIRQQALTAEWSLYKPATESTLNVIRQRNQSGKATFLLASQPVFAESAQAAFLLSEYIAVVRQKGAKQTYKSFFCNSRIEALHGAIKIARHNARLARSASGGTVLVYDRDGFYKDLFDPLSQGPQTALAPGVFFYDGLPGVLMHLSKERISSIAAVVVGLYDDFPMQQLQEMQDRCREKRTILIIDASSHGADGVTESALKLLSDPPEVVIWGEGLTGHQVPFGAFSVLDALYKPWATVATCFVHSSTYGGNSLATSIVRDRILAKLPTASEVVSRLQLIENSPEARMAAFCSYVNPMTPLICHAAKLDLAIKAAKGSRLFIETPSHENINLLDCIGGAGSNLRGYNPDDIGELTESHQANVDYWRRLASLLRELTGLDHAFPAVSGACAVDIAFTMAMLANSDKSRIVIFKGNYAGKSLISLNGSENEFDRIPFAPLYPDVVYLDAFAQDAEAELLKQLRSGKTALVWFEVMQGNSLNRIPDRLLDLVFANKQHCGYVVGIDEILNGMFRTGGFVSFDRDRYEPDIITLSKGLSDLTFPISAVLIAHEIYRKAQHVNSEVVMRYENLFLNQLGAHVAWNGLSKALNCGERVKYAGNWLKSELSRVAGRSWLVKEIRGEGLHLHIVLDMKKFPLFLFGNDFSELLVSRLCLSRGHVLQYFCRLLPPLTIADAELRELADGIERALKVHRFSLFIFGLKQIAVFLSLLSMTQLKSGIARLLERISGCRFG